MTDLLLDASVAVIASQSGNSMGKLAEEVREQGGRLWLYAGEFSDICRLLSSNSASIDNCRQQSLDATLEEFNHFARGCSWLAALSGDVGKIDDPDPMAVALTKAAERISTDTLVLSTQKSRIERGFPFVDESSALASISQSEVLFVDLKAQQDRIRPQLEAGLHRVLHHGGYINGPEITQLENRLADYVGAQHCICVSSGTDALLIAMMTLGIKPGDEIITTPFTFFATSEMIAMLGAVPVYVDIDPHTFNIDASKIEAAFTSKTRAILPVSLYGQCSDMDAINSIAVSYGVSVIEDAAQSFGATYKKQISCSLSEIACTSFFPAKPLGAYGDAGACFTQDTDLAQMMRQIRDHGQERRYQSVRLGLNGRMDTMQAVVLLAKMEIFDSELQKRQKVAASYNAELMSLETEGLLVLPRVESYNTSSWAQYTLRVANRDDVQTSMKSRGIPTAIHYPVPLFEQPAYRSDNSPCPESVRAAREVISIPIHPYLSFKEQKKIVLALTDSLSGSEERMNQRNNVCE
tara:strand:- start:1754 stop:3319 length:1566 start_codon:yes stop_codon:yes gene_type:complete